MDEKRLDVSGSFSKIHWTSRTISRRTSLSFNSIIFIQRRYYFRPIYGNATTAVAALKSERKFVGYEIDKEYIKLSEQRLHSLLAQTKFVFEPTPIYKRNKKAKIKLELAK